jgi:hypothetical protein
MPQPPRSTPDVVVTIPAGVRAYGSLDDLMRDVSAREPFLTSDSKSGSHFERVRYRGEAMILKYVSVDDDWIMRGTGDLDCRALRFFSSALADRIPKQIDHTTVAVAPTRSRRGHRGAALLLRDVSAMLIPPDGTCIDLEQHLRCLDHMAMLHAAFWGWSDDIGLMPMAHHYTFLTPTMAELEAAAGGVDPVPPAVASGWQALDTAAPIVSSTLHDLALDPGPLLVAFESTPTTLIHGDWKFGNIGEHPDGRTILFDWDRVGSAPATCDLAWYIAINCKRLPQTKEATITAYRQSLERHGVATADWWDRQLALALLGAGLQLGWEKVGDRDELGWWQDRIVEGTARLT